jgi:hypothetical protein
MCSRAHTPSNSKDWNANGLWDAESVKFSDLKEVEDALLGKFKELRLPEGNVGINEVADLASAPDFDVFGALS